VKTLSGISGKHFYFYTFFIFQLQSFGFWAGPSDSIGLWAAHHNFNHILAIFCKNLEKFIYISLFDSILDRPFLETFLGYRLDIPGFSFQFSKKKRKFLNLFEHFRACCSCFQLIFELLNKKWTYFEQSLFEQLWTTFEQLDWTFRSCCPTFEWLWTSQ
jgi:hypothetical protein